MLAGEAKLPIPDVNELRIPPRLYFNFDAVSCLVGRQRSGIPNGASGTAKVRVADYTKEELKDRKLSVSITKSVEKERAVKQIYVTAGDGELLNIVRSQPKPKLSSRPSRG